MKLQAQSRVMVIPAVYRASPVNTRMLDSERKDYAWRPVIRLPLR